MSSPPERPARSLAASSGLILAGRLVANAGFFVAVLVLARTLGPEGRGTLAFLTVSTLVVAAFMGFGVSSANSVFVPQRPEQRSRLLTNVAFFNGASSLAGGCLVFGALILFDGLGPGGASDLMYALCIAATVFTALSEAGLGFLIATNRAKSFAVTIVLSAWLYAGLLLSVAVLSDIDAVRALEMWVVAAALTTAIATGAASRGVGFGRLDVHLLSESLRFGFRAWVGNLAGFLNFRLDQILMAYLATDAALGIYAISVNVSEVLLYVPSVVGMLVAPMVARTDDADRGPAVLRAFRGTLIVTILAVAAGAVLGPLLIPPVFGSKFDASVPAFLLLLPGALGYVMMRIFSSALMGSSQPGRSSVAPTVALVASIVLDLALIPSYGANGAAVAATLALLAGGVVAVGLYRRIAPYAWRDIMPGRTDISDLYRAGRRR